jgi:hypothetical protein
VSANDTRSPALGIGTYRGSGTTIPDDLAPGQPPHPSEGEQGPPVSVAIPADAYKQLQEQIDKLADAMSLRQRPDQVIGSAAAQTDSSGNLALLLYRVAAGFTGRLNRLTVNGLKVADGTAYTAGSPYVSATAYLSLYQADSEIATGESGLMDFAPMNTVSGGATTRVLPYLFNDSNTQAAAVKGPMAFVLTGAGLPDSALIVARYQITLQRMRGPA